MSKSYTLRLFIISAILAAITLGANLSNMMVTPIYTWIGLGYLVVVTLAIHAYVQAARDRGNSLIRRLMVASILRMLAALLFLLITLLNTKPVNLNFVIFYCGYFCVFMLFEISQMRTNLRPDFNPRPKNENA